MTMGVTVEVTGIKEFARDLKKVDTELAKNLRKAFLEIAKNIAGKAKARVPSRSGRAASSIRAKATANGASIAWGGSKAPYMPWLDFGGRVGKNKSIHRAFVKEGRYVFPIIKDERSNTIQAVKDALDDAAHGAGF